VPVLIKPNTAKGLNGVLNEIIKAVISGLNFKSGFEWYKMGREPAII